MLENDFVILRPITISDTENILRWRNSEAVRKYFLMKEELTKENHEYWLKEIVGKEKAVQFIIVDKKDNKDVGTIYARNINKDTLSAEYGIYIGEESVRGKGIGYNASLLFCKYCFENLNLKKLDLRVLKNNYKAISLYEKVGFKSDFNSMLDEPSDDVLFMKYDNPMLLEKTKKFVYNI